MDTRKHRNLFQQIEREAFRAGITPKTKESVEWMRKRAQDLRAGKFNRNEIMKEEALRFRNRQGVGNMYFWFYDPKYKKTLPYYDSFPLGIIVEPAENGFYALNLHYLPPLLRAKFFNQLLELTTNKKWNDNTKFKLTYEFLKTTAKYKEFKPCFKRYLTKHVRSRFALVQPKDWEIGVFLPAAAWQKSDANSIYRQSRKMI